MYRLLPSISRDRETESAHKVCKPLEGMRAIEARTDQLRSVRTVDVEKDDGLTEGGWTDWQG